MVVHVEYIPARHAEAKLPADEDPFRHQSLTNSHNHHDLHPWGDGVQVPSKDFDALYAEANNQYMYQRWYTPALGPYMATELIAIHPLEPQLLQSFLSCLKAIMASGDDIAFDTGDARFLMHSLGSILNKSGVKKEDRLFVRLGATSAKDSFAVNVPTTKPPPLEPDPETLARRILTSGRCANRLLSLSECVWSADPGECLVFLKWSPEIQLQSEFRVFCYEGHVTAISQDIWWEGMGWRERYSEGFAESIIALWEDVKDLLHFKTCTMDVLMQEDSSNAYGWRAKVIEFGAFGKHLNTGSDLFHWVNDASTLQSSGENITLRFVDDWADQPVKLEDEVKIETTTLVDQTPADVTDAKPDWFTLEEKLRRKLSYTQDSGNVKLSVPAKLRFPLRGRWCSAY
ncbi:MAG: hypothetical protein Q9164_006766 [Protoblastenia rupestris]